MHRHLNAGGRAPAQLALLLALLTAPGLALAAQAAPPLQAVLANGYRFAYAERGTGRPVVLVHGELDDYRRWDRLGVELADSARVIAYSRRYHFPNPWREDDPPANHSSSAHDLAAILRALRLERAVLVSDSWAAAIVLEAARREPSLVAGIVLVEPLLPPAEMRGDGTSARSTAPRPRASDNAAAATLETALPGPSCQSLGAIVPPILVFRGEAGDPRVGDAVATLLRCRPGAQSVTLPLGGDLAELGAGPLAARVKEWLATLPR